MTSPTHRTRKKRDWGPAFLAAFAETHLVTEAAKCAGVHRSTVYERRDKDEGFAEAWADIEERSTEQLEQVAVRRATEGSDVLLIFLLKARRPNVYREYKHIQHSGPDGGPLGLRVELDERQRKALSDVLRGRPASSGS